MSKYDYILHLVQKAGNYARLARAHHELEGHEIVREGYLKLLNETVSELLPLLYTSGLYHRIPNQIDAFIRSLPESRTRAGERARKNIVKGLQAAIEA